MPIRRLNRAEYENTVRDLLGVDIDLKEVLPPDTPVNGFDNGAEALHVSSFLMEQYLEAADKVLDAAIVNGPKPWMINKRFDIKDEKSVKPKGSVYRHLEDAVAIFSSWVSANIQVTLWSCYTHFRGNYRFRISAYAFQSDKPITFHMMAGTFSAVTEERIRRLLRRAAGQADRRRVCRSPGGEELYSDRGGQSGRDASRDRENRGGELQGTGPGGAVGRGRRAAARNLAAAKPSTTVRGPEASADPDCRGQAVAWKWSRKTQWPMPNALCVPSCGVPTGGP